MPDLFPRTRRALAVDHVLGQLMGILIAVALLAAWGLWFVVAPLTVYRTSEEARLETMARVHPIDATLAGRIVRTSLALGSEVQAGEVLVELDAATQELALAEERTRFAARPPQIAALMREIATEQRALESTRAAASTSLEAAQIRRQHAAEVSRIADDVAARYLALTKSQFGSMVEYLRVASQAEQAHAADDATRFEFKRLQQDLKWQDDDRLAHIAALDRESERLIGEQNTAAAAIARLEQEIEKRRLRAPVSGRIAALAPEMRPGAFVGEGARMGAIVPSQETMAVAEFVPSVALGHIQPGQETTLRLAGFPWVQYGSIPARVRDVASEPRDGRIRVEFAVDAARAPRIPLRNGLPGTVEVAIERASPAVLVLRAAGRLLTKPAPASHD
jgi:membrane fusion protein (multidrug efflux system)